jgi:protein-S-isoprenylcysteine O-methyltransferase
LTLEPALTLIDPTLLYWIARILGLGYLAFELFLLITRRGKEKGRPADRGTLYAVWILIAGSCFLGFLLAPLITALRWPQSWFIICLGGFFLVTGLALRIWAIRHLGKFFTVDVGIQQGHMVIQDGPYRFVRHPSYSGSLLALVGVGFLTFNWLGLFLVVTCTMLAYALRISVEEKALLAQLGAQYADYTARTKRLIPGIY